jgi:glycine/D-amino acid oxidase-like deaminating enzyme
VIGGGFSGHGFKFGPLIGEILADLAMGRDPEIPAERFAARRPV